MSPDQCIDCNWAYSGLLDSIVLIVAALNALLAALAALDEATGFAGSGPNAAAYNTGTDIAEGIAQGVLPPSTPTPTPMPTTTPPPPQAPGIGEQLFRIIGYDLEHLGQQ